jgi:acyl-CoA synthetase (AMP-forming)/AMP-acid ligase II
MVGLVFPLSLGLKAAFHANPTETESLLLLVRDYRLTLLAAPPTFLEAMLDKAKRLDTSQGINLLASLRFAFAGAEKCPEHVYRAFAEACPNAALCEGYGITECSPVVSINRPDAVVPGSIGHALPSVTIALVREEDGHIKERAHMGETGMLLVRGLSIFGGYLGDAPNPFVNFAGHTWYRTGDLVSMDATGRLTFQGRLKRFVKIGGEMISLPQIESVLLAAFAGHPGIPQDSPALAVEASPEGTGAEIALFTPLALTLAEVNGALRTAGLSALYTIKRIVTVETIPLLGSGKTDYRALQQQLRG